jgi:hypothetical protein
MSPICESCLLYVSRVSCISCSNLQRKLTVETFYIYHIKLILYVAFTFQITRYIYISSDILPGVNVSAGNCGGGSSTTLWGVSGIKCVRTCVRACVRACVRVWVSSEGINVHNLLNRYNMCERGCVSVGVGVCGCTYECFLRDECKYSPKWVYCVLYVRLRAPGGVG